MEIFPYFIYAGLFIILFFLIFSCYWVYALEDPSISSNCKKAKNDGWKWDAKCLYIREIFSDPSLKDPEELPYIGKFEFSAPLGPPLCKPMWYCYRFVNVKTGGYSKFSKWTQSPIYSGSEELPCLGGVGKCTGISQGQESCTFNRPTIGVPSLVYNPMEITSSGSFIYANLHRYVGEIGDTEPPSENPEDVKTQIVGYFIPDSSMTGLEYAWADVLYNPCLSGGCPGDCPGC